MFSDLFKIRIETISFGVYWAARKYFHVFKFQECKFNSRRRSVSHTIFKTNHFLVFFEGQNRLCHHLNIFMIWKSFKYVQSQWLFRIFIQSNALVNRIFGEFPFFCWMAIQMRQVSIGLKCFTWIKTIFGKQNRSFLVKYVCCGFILTDEIHVFKNKSIFWVSNRSLVLISTPNKAINWSIENDIFSTRRNLICWAKSSQHGVWRA